MGRKAFCIFIIGAFLVLVALLAQAWRTNRLVEENEVLRQQLYQEMMEHEAALAEN